MANRVIKSFRDKTDGHKLYRAKNKDGKSDVYESKDSKRIAFLVKEGFLEEEKSGKSPDPVEEKKSSKKKKGD